MEEFRTEIQDLFREVFDDDELILADEMTADDVDGWDSLMHINLIVAIEERYGVKFATAEISNLKGEGQNIGTFLQLITEKRSRLQ